MTLRLLTLLKRLVGFGSRRRHSQKVSADAPRRPHEGIKQTRTYCSCGTQTLHGTTTTEASTESTYLATSSLSAESCPGPPWISPELLSLILVELWEAPQAPEERSALLQRAILVNHTWLVLMARIASRSVHISNAHNASAFIRLLSRQSESQTRTATLEDPFTRESAPFANEMCRSITFYVDRRAPPGGVLPQATSITIPPDPLYVSSPARDACKAFSLVLRTISAPGHQYVPNLEHISFRYVDMGYSDIFKHLEREPFPQPVVRLSVDHTFTVPCSEYALRDDWLTTRDKHRGFAPRHRSGTATGVASVAQPVWNVRHLSLSGATTAVTTAILRVCPNVETLALPVPCSVCLELIGPLPPALRTLVLRHPGLAALAQLRRGSEKDWYWALCSALDDGRVFPRRPAITVGGSLSTRSNKLPPPRIITRLSTHDPALFAALRGSCERANVELVYECDNNWGPSF